MHFLCGWGITECATLDSPRLVGMSSPSPTGIGRFGGVRQGLVW